MDTMRAAALDVASNSDLDQPTQYLLQRLVESLNDGASFVSAATLTADPISVLSELVERARASANHSRSAPKFGVLYDNYRLALATLRDIKDLPHWYGNVLPLIQGLERATDPRQAAAHQYELGRWLEREGWPTLRDYAVPLVRAMRLDYTDRILAKVLARRSSTMQRPGHWIDYDDDIRHLMAALMGEGRPATWICERAIAACRSASDPRTALASDLRSDPVRFQVALSIKHARSVQHAAAFGCHAGVDGWPEPTSVAASHTLTTFARSETAAGNWPFVVTTDAYDREHAVTRARATADELVAQLAANHRTRAITLGPHALVWQGGRRVSHVEATVPPSRPLTPRLPQREPRLAESMAHLQHSRDARAPMAGILHGWIALEPLAYRLPQPHGIPGDRQRQAVPYDTLGHAVSRVVALHGVRQGLLDLWHVVVKSERRRGSPRWMEVEEWLQVTSARNLADVNRWFDLLAADTANQTPPTGSPSSRAEAAVLAASCLESGPAFPRRQFQLWRDRIAHRTRMAEFYDTLIWDTAGQITRLYAARNLTVHQAATTPPGGEELARAATRLLDLMLEILPAWLAAAPGDPPAVPIDTLARRAGYVRSQWTPAHSGRVRLNLDQLTWPGGDGINR